MNTLQLDCALSYLNEGAIMDPITFMSESVFAESRELTRLLESIDLGYVTEMKQKGRVARAFDTVIDKLKEMWEKFKNFIKGVIEKLKKAKDFIVKKFKGLFASKDKAAAKEADKKADNINVDLSGKGEEVNESVLYEADSGVNITISNFKVDVICKDEKLGFIYLGDDDFSKCEKIFSNAIDAIKHNRDFDENSDITRIHTAETTDSTDEKGNSLQTYHSFEKAMDVLTAEEAKCVKFITKLGEYTFELEQIKKDAEKQMKNLQDMTRTGAESYSDEIKKEIDSMKYMMTRCTKFSRTIVGMIRKIIMIESRISKQYYKLVKTVYKVNGQKFNLEARKKELIDHSWDVGSLAAND